MIRLGDVEARCDAPESAREGVCENPRARDEGRVTLDVLEVLRDIVDVLSGFSQGATKWPAIETPLTP